MINNGDILFFKSDGSVSSRIISTFTKSEFVHVGVAHYIFKELYILESQYGYDRRMVHFDFYKDRKYVIIESNILDKDIDKILPSLGMVKYGYKDVLLVGIKSLLKRLGFNIEFKNYQGEICSEFVAILCNIKPSNISPEELYQYLKKHGFKENYENY